GHELDARVGLRCDIGDQRNVLFDGVVVAQGKRLGAVRAGAYAWRFTPPASTQIMLAPIFVIARSTLAEAPSPMAMTQITAPTPMMIPSIVRPVRSLFRDRALSAIRGITSGFMVHFG